MAAPPPLSPPPSSAFTAAPTVTRADLVVVAVAVVAAFIVVRRADLDVVLVPVTVLAALAAVVSRFVGLRGSGLVNVLEVAAWPGTTWHRLQCGLRWVFWTVVAASVHLAVPAGPSRLRQLLVCWSAVAVLLLSAAFPRVRMRSAGLVLLGAGTVFLALQVIRLGSPPADAMVLRLPFEGEWRVVEGGRSVLVNTHYGSSGRRHTVDFTRGDPTRPARVLESHPCFEQRVLAPARGEIVEVVEALRDLPLGDAREERPSGNHVVIDIGGGRQVVLGNLREDSVPVGVGDDVRAGQIVGRCGNSGDAGTPQLRLVVRGAGGDSLPVVFRGVEVTRGGRTFRPERAGLRRNDVVRPAPPRR